MQIIKSRLGIIVIPTITEGVDIADATCVPADIVAAAVGDACDLILISIIKADKIIAALI
ncbi:MAG: hypothetical protein PHH84_01190 [Oscillospiraceae bacterium]|nr:hypothetical protein [Oscillospiraceae bacterium]MDD4412938.1 hypothetical protein [Oscillospiraceae bacterium]